MKKVSNLLVGPIMITEKSILIKACSVYQVLIKQETKYSSTKTKTTQVSWQKKAHRPTQIKQSLNKGSWLGGLNMLDYRQVEGNKH